MNNNSIRALALGLGLWLSGNVNAEEPPEKVATVTFRQGKVQVPKDGKLIETTNTVQVAALALVQTNGLFTVNQGKERQLTEGQTIDSSGMLTSPDGSVVPIVDHLFVKGGRIQIVKDGTASPLVGEFPLPDGSKVTAD